MTTATTHDFKITPEWVRAGNAIFTVANTTGEHYTYRVLWKKINPKNYPFLYFVSLLTGPENDINYTYLGILDPANGEIQLTKKSKYRPDTKPVRVAQWAARLIWAGTEPPAGYSIAGAGCCGRCGRTLTHPDGVADSGYRLGYGPECWKIINGEK